MNSQSDSTVVVRVVAILVIGVLISIAQLVLVPQVPGLITTVVLALLAAFLSVYKDVFRKGAEAQDESDDLEVFEFLIVDHDHPHQGKSTQVVIPREDEDDGPPAVHIIE